MKRIFILFAVMAVSFGVSVNLYSSSEGVGKNAREIIVYCAYNWEEGTCEKALEGDACYMVDENCDWMDEEEQSEDD